MLSVSTPSSPSAMKRTESTRAAQTILKRRITIEKKDNASWGDFIIPTPDASSTRRLKEDRIPSQLGNGYMTYLITNDAVLDESRRKATMIGRSMLRGFTVASR